MDNTNKNDIINDLKTLVGYHDEFAELAYRYNECEEKQKTPVKPRFRVFNKMLSPFGDDCTITRGGTRKIPRTSKFAVIFGGLFLPTEKYSYTITGEMNEIISSFENGEVKVEKISGHCFRSKPQNTVRIALIVAVCTLQLINTGLLLPALLLGNIAFSAYHFKKNDCKKWNEEIAKQIESDKKQYEKDVANHPNLVSEMRAEQSHISSRIDDLIYKCNKVGVLPEPFCNPDEIDYKTPGMPKATYKILEYFEQRRVSTIQEAINLYITEDKEFAKNESEATHRNAMLKEQQRATVAHQAAQKAAEDAKTYAEKAAEDAKKSLKNTEKMAEDAKKTREMAEDMKNKLNQK